MMDGHLVWTDSLLRLGSATFLGLLLGLDREWRGKAAGLRTHMLVALSSAATTLVAMEMFLAAAAGEGGKGGEVDPVRVVQGLAQAIGFICAGVIIRGRGNDVRNLTTAATLWTAGALGIACGAGFHLIAGLTAGLTLLVLLIAGWAEKRYFENDRPDRSSRSDADGHR